MSISQQQQYNSLSHKVFSPNTFYSESVGSQDRIGVVQNAQFRQKQHANGCSIFSASNNVSFDTDNFASTVPSNTSTMIAIPTTNKSQLDDRCHQHPNKKLKYQKISDEKERFCSACAVEKVQQGQDVELIVKDQSREFSTQNQKQLNKDNKNQQSNISQINQDNFQLQSSTSYN